MSVRLNKAISELNIGLQTAVDFLVKHPKLGEVKPELSFKLNDEQYDALVAAFKGDKEVLEDLLNILASSVGSLTNTTKLENTFKSERGVRISHNTISAYIDTFIDLDNDLNWKKEMEDYLKES